MRIGFGTLFLSLLFHGVSSAPTNENPNWWEDLTLVIHRNGETDQCGTAIPKQSSFADIASSDNKYHFESALTNLVAEMMLDKSSCGTPDDANAPEGIFGFCDMGEKRTPVLLDHEKLVPVKDGSLPCSWYTREGVRISSLDALKSFVEKAKQSSSETCANPQDDVCEGDTAEFHLYGVQAGRVFMFAPAYVGEIFDLNHLSMKPDADKPIYMEVLSVNPRVFDIFNVFSKEEAGEVITRALSEESPTNGLKRSTTGSNEKSIFAKRTSENAFDTHGKTALKLKKRIFELVGYDEFKEGHDDGLQVLRYNKTKAYVQHMDYLQDNSGEQLFNYDSAGKGGNRFATVLLYMTDLPENAGGETVFSEAWPSNVAERDRKELSQAVKELRASGDAEAAGIRKGSWEEELVARCRSRLTIRPSAGRAVLFYSQFPNGKEDKMSEHGGCPVLIGEKWAANLWVWNTPRSEDMKGAPLREDLLAKGRKPNIQNMLHGRFRNTGKDPALKEAELWYDEAQFWGKLGHGDPDLTVNTYEGHRWNVRVDGKVIKKFVIQKEPTRQVFEI